MRAFRTTISESKSRRAIASAETLDQRKVRALRSRPVYFVSVVVKYDTISAENHLTPAVGSKYPLLVYSSQIV